MMDIIFNLLLPVFSAGIIAFLLFFKVKNLKYRLLLGIAVLFLCWLLERAYVIDFLPSLVFGVSFVLTTMAVSFVERGAR